MHKVKIYSSGEDSDAVRLEVDGMDISQSCLWFRLEKKGGEYPVLHLALSCSDVETDIDAVETMVKLSCPVGTSLVD